MGDALCADVTRKLLGVPEQATTMAMSVPYWTALAGCLRSLILEVDFAVPQHASDALCQLTALQSLTLFGGGNAWGSLHLQLLQLETLYIGGQTFTSLELVCPRLTTVRFRGVQLRQFSGLGSSLRRL